MTGAVKTRVRLAPWLLLLALAALVVLPAAARASGDGGDKQTGGGDKPAAQPDAQVVAAKDAAEADPSIAAVLAGKDAAVESAVWGGTEAQRAGVTLVYRWAATAATSIDQTWPLLRSGDGTPTSPYDSSTYRIRASEVSALRVDVLSDGARILQVMPVDGETQFTLEEQTWAPFSWFPWFTSRPWVLAPVFLLLFVLLIARAWRRSRAWNRRLPSMTRHDRQFIGRVAVLLFLLAGFAWQFYEGWYAATGPSVGTSCVRRRLPRVAALAAHPTRAVRRRSHPGAQFRSSPGLLGAAGRPLRRRERLLPRRGGHRRHDQPQPHVLHPPRRAGPHLGPPGVLLGQDGLEPERAPVQLSRGLQPGPAPPLSGRPQRPPSARPDPFATLSSRRQQTRRGGRCADRSSPLRWRP